MGLKGDKSVGFEQHQNCPSLSKVVLREVRCVWFFGWLCMFVLVELRTETAEREFDYSGGIALSSDFEWFI